MQNTSQSSNQPEKKVAHSLVAAGVAAVLAVYIAGYSRTRSGTPANVSPVTLPPQTSASLAKWKDGSWSGWGRSPHGDIEATVVIEGGRIRSAVISQCRTRYSCSVISDLLPQVTQRQDPEIDYVSGATESTNAFYYALVGALGKASRNPAARAGAVLE